MTKKLTRDQVLTAFGRLEATVREWEESADPEIFRVFRGRLTRVMSIAIDEAAGMLFELCQRQDVADDAKPLVLAIDEFEDAMAEFVDQCSMSPDDADPNGTPRLWGAYREIVRTIEQPVRNKRPEPIQQLLGEGVPRKQIAKIYGWYEDGGTPDLGKLQAEITTPGKHYDPKTWQSRQYREYCQRIDEQWSARANREIQSRQTNGQKETGKKESPESLDELIALPNITAAQIAKMKQVSVEEVMKRAAELRMPLDADTMMYGSYREAQQAAVDRRQAQLRRAMELAELDTYPDVADSDERVKRMAADGVDHHDIAESLREAIPGLTYQRVGQIVFGTQRQPVK